MKRTIVTPHTKIILSSDKKPIALLSRKSWDSMLQDWDKVSILHIIRFEPENDTLVLQYDTRSFPDDYARLMDVYIYRPHLKLLEKMSEYEELRDGIRHYLLRSTNAKEQFMTLIDEHNEYWDSIKQETKDWMMGIILGGRNG